MKNKDERLIIKKQISMTGGMKHQLEMVARHYGMQEKEIIFKLIAEKYKKIYGRN